MANLIGQSLGRYRILEQLGEGGMATVYKAYDTSLERNVAIKVIRRNALPQEQLERVRQRFEREAKALAKLSHPNIVKVIDYGEHDDAPYLVLEYLPGGTLKARMKGRAIPWQEAVRLLIPIANALGYAHEQNVIHRDVKPANILLTVNGQPMLSDFGIAKILEMEDGQTLTGTGVGLGTPEYMSPEQGLGQKVDARADIYSLGIVLYEMLTGRKPFRADTPMAIIVKHINDPLPSPSQYVSDLSVAVENMVLKALEKKPENRYQGMGEFVSLMNALVAGGMLKSNQALSESTGTVTEVLSPSSIVSTRMVGWFAMGALAIVLLVGFIGWMAIPPMPPATEEPVGETLIATEAPVVTEAPIVTEVPVVTEAPIVTDVPVATESPVTTEAPIATEVPALDIGSTMISEDGANLVYVPADEFTMGSDAFPEEMPIHTVYLDAFWIDQTEVTNGMYVKCVNAGVCQVPLATTSRTHVNYYGNSEFNNYPVVAVKWDMAKVYCEWAGRRLPTEAEWEKAARGSDGHIYPWGNDAPNNSLLNYNSSVGDTTEARKYPDGKSIYGAYDMAGNVWEWVNDWYGETYYQSSPFSNPTGPDSGSERVMRGGSWEGTDISVRSVSRGYLNLVESTDRYGFRCARSVP